MTRFRTRIAVVGYAFFGASVTIFVVGMLFGIDSVPAVLTGDLIPVAFFTVATMVTAIAILLPMIPKQETTSLNVETGNGGQTVGVRFDRRLTGWLVIVPKDERQRIREELRETALQTLVRATDCSRETAHEKVETGNWTNDRIAASFFAPTGQDWQSQTRAILRQIRFKNRLKRTVRALQTIESKNE